LFDGPFLHTLLDAQFVIQIVIRDPPGIRAVVLNAVLTQLFWGTNPNLPIPT